MATKNKLEIINKFDKYQVWWIDHISHNQWKSMSEAKKENEEAVITKQDLGSNIINVNFGRKH